jgi:hypothetical protein
MLHRVRSAILIALVQVSLGGCQTPRDEPVPRPGQTPTVGGMGSGGPKTPAGPADDGGAPTDGPPGSTCEPGTHSCPAGCVDDKSPMSCGTACEPCPSVNGGTATCDGVKCGVSCPTGKKPCLDGCVDMMAACEGTCAAGKNPCNGICVDAKSLSSCGSSCSPCPTSPNGAASCDGDKCDLKCNPGYHRCKDACVSDKDPATCGTSCDSCPPPMGGKATCDGTMCGIMCPQGTTPCNGNCIPTGQACQGMCPAGKHACNNNCVSNMETSNCGPNNCMPCPAHDNADATCDGTKCGYTCRAGFHDCSGSCKDNKSIASCGTSSCDPCPGTDNGTATCDGSKCAIRCNDGFRACGPSQCVGPAQPCNGACPTGMLLCTGKCVPGGAGACCTDAECGACKTCQNNRCQNTASNQPGPMCDGPCKQCQNGACANKTGTCGPQACTSGNIMEQRCMNGACQPALVKDCMGKGCTASGCNECQTGTKMCSMTVARNCVGGTFQDTDCGTRGCVNGACCGQGQVNCNNRCVQCCENRDCQPNQECNANHACVTACGKLNQPCCAGACDPAFFCDLGANLCRTRTKFGAQCQIDDECPAGGHCIFGGIVSAGKVHSDIKVCCAGSVPAMSPDGFPRPGDGSGGCKACNVCGSGGTCVSAPFGVGEDLCPSDEFCDGIQPEGTCRGP